MFFGQSARAQILQNRSKHGGRRGNIEQRLHFASRLFVDLGQVFSQSIEGGRIVVTTGDISRAGGNSRPHIVGQFTPREFLDRCSRQFTEGVVGNRFAPITDQMEVGREQVIRREVINCGNELAGRQVAGSTKNHHRGRRCATMFAKVLEKRMAGRSFGHRP